MTKNTEHVIHIHSKQVIGNKPKLPTQDKLAEGEIAVNYAEDVETLSIKNESGNVITFSSDNYYTEQKLGSAFTDNDVTVTNVTNNISDVANAAAVGVLSLKESKADLSAFTEHTASTVHMTETEKTNLDSLATNIGTISGITANDVDAWNAAAGTDLTQYYKKTETSGKTELSTAFDLKADKTDLTSLSGTVTAHTANTDIHVTTADKTAWDAKAELSDIPSVNGYADSVKYNSTSKEVEFYHGGTGGTKVFSYDASPFLIDGMVQNVEIKNVTSGESQVTCLVISFNTDAGKQDINIPISQIFDANNYYTTAQTDTKITEATSGKVDNTTYTAYTAATATEIGNKLATSDFNTYSGTVNTSLNSKASQSDLNTLSGTVTAHTADSTIHLTSGNVQTQIDNSISGKTNQSDFSAHTANTTVHITAEERTSWNAKSDFSGSYNDLTDKPTIPSKTSDLTNDSDFATSGYVQAVTSDMATETWVNGQGYLTSADISGKQDISGMTAYTTTATTNELSGTVTAHTANTEIHVTTEDKSKWNNVDNKLNTSDFNTYSGTVDTAISNKVDKVEGKGLSTNDFTNELKTKLDSIAEGAEVNVQANWTEGDTTSDSYIQNKPTLGTAAAKGVSNGITNSDNLIEAKHIYSGVGVTVDYESESHYIQLKNTAGSVLSSFDASTFLVDGMVDSVTLETKSGTTYLVITWNTAAGKTSTELNVGDIFEADNYYTKSETSGATELSTEFALYTKKTDVDQAINSTTSASTGAVSTSAVYGFVTSYTPSITVDQVIDETTSASTNPVATKAVYDYVSDIEFVVSTALNDLETNKLDTSAFTEHSENTDIHLSSAEKTNIDSLSTNIATISGISASDVTKWNNSEEVEVNTGDTPTGDTIELWIDESIEPVTVEVYTKAETNALLNNKSDKTSTVSNVSYDNESGKLQETINGTTTDIVNIVNSGFRFEFNDGVLNLIPVGTATATVTNGVLNLTF